MSEAPVFTMISRGMSSGSVVSRSLKFETLLDLVPLNGLFLRPLEDSVTPHKKAPLSYSQLHQFCAEVFPSILSHAEKIPSNVGIEFGNLKNESPRHSGRLRIATILPSGAEAAVLVCATIAVACCTPVNHNSTVDELIGDLKSFRSEIVIVLDGVENISVFEAAAKIGIPVISVAPCCDVEGLTSFASIIQPPAVCAVAPAQREKVFDIESGFSRREDNVLVLHTSGTSGKKKKVPYTLDSLVVGSTLVALSWGLESSDIGLNMMPLFHIGGISRNVFGPLLSGGSIVCLPAFSPSDFWIAVSQIAISWYYAGPTMHHQILSFVKEGGIPRRCAIRMVANAAGGLLPSIAQELQSVFSGAVILPSYGMTECMPISTPPLDYRLDRPGTSGISIGPELSIFSMDEDGLDRSEPQPVASMTVGRIAVRGAPVFRGYEDGGDANNEAFFGEGWFDTGDLGYLDADGYLYITGRSKEVINRGGEIISPFEVEEVYLQHPSISQAIAVSIPHDTLQEVVGLVIVPCDPKNPLPSDLQLMQRFASGKLHPSKWPQALIIMNDLPKGPTGKVQRIGFASRANIHQLTDSMPPAARVFEAIKIGGDSKTLSCTPLIPDVALILATINKILADESFAAPRLCIASKQLPSGAATDIVVYIVQEDSVDEFNHIEDVETGKNSSIPSDVDPESLLALLFQRLAAHHVPAAIVHLPRLPLKPIGPSSNTSTPLIAVLCSEGLVPAEFVVNTTELPGLPSGARSARRAIVDKFYSSPIKTVSSVLFAQVYKAKSATSLSNMMTSTRRRSSSNVSLSTQGAATNSSTSATIQQIWIDLLDGAAGLGLDDDFFEAGGNSLVAGRLVAAIRAATGVNLSAAAVFDKRTVRSMAHLVDQKRKPVDAQETPKKASSSQSKSSSCIIDVLPASPTPRRNETMTFDEESDTHAAEDDLLVMAIQLIPLLVLLPLKRMIIASSVLILWFFLMSAHQIFVHFSSQSDSPTTNDGTFFTFKLEAFPALLLALWITRKLILGRVVPIIGVFLKWVIIGKYRQGRHPVFGCYYLRWFIVDQALDIFGKGEFDATPAGVRTYLRLLGATISDRAIISPLAVLREHDLISIGEGAILDNCLCRGFAVDKGSMILKRVFVGKGACVGQKSVVAPGTKVGAGICLGPLTSSYEAALDVLSELPAVCSSEGVESNKCVCYVGRFGCQGWRRTLLGEPALLLIELCGALPLLHILAALSVGADAISSVPEFWLWAASARTIACVLLLFAAKAVISPFLELIAAVIVKRALVGTIKPGPREPPSSRQAFAIWLSGKLVGPDLRGVARLVGTHYELISVIYRALGAKIGKRIYWPGTGVAIGGLFDLVEIGDDVTFGSRSVFIPADVYDVAKVTVEAGAMIADRCVLLGDVRVGRKSTLGTGSLAPRGFTTLPGSTWVGSRRGGPVHLHTPAGSDSSPTIGPFGRAFYLREASYWVMPLHAIVAFNVSVLAATSCWHGFGIVVAPVLLAFHYQSLGVGALVGPGSVATVFLLVAVATTLFSVATVALELLSKWSIIGRRTAGAKPWDENSYCQRWQMYLTVGSSLRGDVSSERSILSYIQGTGFLNSYFRAQGATIAGRVLLYPTGGDPMMTEPDLVTIEEGVCIDNASLICHINSRGQFGLNPLRVERGATMRSMSRLLSGAVMEPDSTLLEHTLVLSGDIAPTSTTMHGWPAEEVDAEVVNVSPARKAE